MRPEMPSCHLCDDQFPSIKQLKTHFLDTHNNIHPFKCKHCSKRWPSKNDLQRHSDLCVAANQSTASARSGFKSKRLKLKRENTAAYSSEEHSDDESDDLNYDDMLRHEPRGRSIGMGRDRKRQRTAFTNSSFRRSRSRSRGRRRRYRRSVSSSRSLPRSDPDFHIPRLPPIAPPPIPQLPILPQTFDTPDNGKYDIQAWLKTTQLSWNRKKSRAHTVLSSDGTIIDSYKIVLSRSRVASRPPPPPKRTKSHQTQYPRFDKNRVGEWIVWLDEGRLDQRGPYRTREEARIRIRELKRQAEYSGGLRRTSAASHAKRNSTTSNATRGRSRFIGVRVLLSGFKAETAHQGAKINLGKFETELEAAKAYNEAAYKLRGSEAKINVFTGEEEEQLRRLAANKYSTLSSDTRKAPDDGHVTTLLSQPCGSSQEADRDAQKPKVDHGSTHKVGIRSSRSRSRSRGRPLTAANGKPRPNSRSRSRSPGPEAAKRVRSGPCDGSDSGLDYSDADQDAPMTEGVDANTKRLYEKYCEENPVNSESELSDHSSSEEDQPLP